MAEDHSVDHPPSAKHHALNSFSLRQVLSRSLTSITTAFRKLGLSETKTEVRARKAREKLAAAEIQTLRATPDEADLFRPSFDEERAQTNPSRGFALAGSSTGAASLRIPTTLKPSITELPTLNARQPPLAPKKPTYVLAAIPAFKPVAQLLSKAVAGIQSGSDLTIEFRELYEIGAHLGEGAFGYVFVGQCRTTGNEVAMKFIIASKIKNTTGIVDSDCF